MNVLGTVVVLEAVKARLNRIPGLAYASSTAVYNAADPSPAPESGGTAPSTLYGVFKLANEGTARVLLDRRRVASIGIRPYVVYGPGRDQGITSGPSLAMEAAARGDGYTIGVRRNRAVRLRARRGPRLRARGPSCFGGCPRRELPGLPSTMQEVVDAIEAAAPVLAGTVFWEEGQLPFPESLQGNLLERLVGPLPRTPLADGVRATIEHFRHAASTRREGLVGSRGAC